jgi:CRP-like cAMP-binding protein
MNSDSRFAEFLQSVPALAEFGPQELDILEQALIVDQYPDGHEFFGEDKRGASLYLIIEGKVIATHRRLQLRGLDIFERLGPGDLFGLVALIDHRPAWATYRAEGIVTAASLPVTAFELLFTADAPIAHHFQNLIAMQLVRDLRRCVRILMNLKIIN